MTTETQPPARIWLQIPERDPDEPFVADGWTWCQDSVNDTDVEYVRADLALPMPVLREEDRSAQVAEVMRLVDATMRYSGAADDFREEATYAALESAVRRLAGV